MTIKLKTYASIKDMLRDPALDDVLNHISGLSTTIIEARTGVSHTTINNWRKGKTRRPQNATMEFALRAAGFKRIIVRDE